MGKIEQGILGGLSGKVGNVIGGNWKGIDYIRIKPSEVSNPRTEGQVSQRNKFTATLEFLQPNLDFIKIGFKGFTNQRSEFNAAMSYNLLNAITGTAPNYEVDYPNALVSRGNLATALNGSNDFTTPGQVDFSWDDNSNYGNANADDKSMLLVYNPDKSLSSFILQGADRSVGSQSVIIPDNFAGDTVQVYMAFISSDGEKVSNSVYLGSGTAS